MNHVSGFSGVKKNVAWWIIFGSNESVTENPLTHICFYNIGTLQVQDITRRQRFFQEYNWLIEIQPVIYPSLYLFVCIAIIQMTGLQWGPVVLSLLLVKCISVQTEQLHTIKSYQPELHNWTSAALQPGMLNTSGPIKRLSALFSCRRQLVQLLHEQHIDWFCVEIREPSSLSVNLIWSYTRFHKEFKLVLHEKPMKWCQICGHAFIYFFNFLALHKTGTDSCQSWNVKKDFLFF